MPRAGGTRPAIGVLPALLVGIVPLVAGCEASSGSGHFRVRADFATALNADAGWAGALDENVTIQADRPFRLRFEVERPAGAPAGEPFRLQYRRTGQDWTNVEAHEFPYADVDDAQTPRVSIVTCDAYQNETPTTDLLRGSATTFTPGVGMSLSQLTPPWAGAGSHGEFEWALVIRRFADGAVTNDEGDTFQFRMVSGSGTPVARIRKSAAPPVDSAAQSWRNVRRNARTDRPVAGVEWRLVLHNGAGRDGQRLHDGQVDRSRSDLARS